MLQWFIRFPEFAETTEFNDSSAQYKKDSNVIYEKSDSLVNR